MPHAQESAPHARPPLPSPPEIAALPPDGGPEFNRLVFSASPYLLQHARNPVDWYPWGEEAFERARREDKPIFLSIGYSTCHWCHVMERESFEDAEVAALLDEHFVCVKVDREERPDVDQVYMSVTQAMTGSGGWPMTVVLTPDRRPFFAGTYFPKHGRHGRPGMMELLPGLARAWAERRDDVVESAQRAVDWLASSGAGSAGELPSEEELAQAAAQLARSFDTQHGGFGGAPKFPVPHNLRLLLRHGQRTGDEKSTAMVIQTLRAMRRGGIWDQVGHGFHRYSTDEQWLLPHFEKMLYDQALMAMACVEAWQVTGADDLRETAERTFEYVLRDMTSPQGAFWSAEDADSEGEEGLFYLWTPDQLADVLGHSDGALAGALWGVVEGGNFRDQASGERVGGSILHLPEPLEAFAARYELEPAALRERVEQWRRKLFAAREARVHPFKDDKVLTDWNGLMIAALALGGRAFDEPRYVQSAARAADFVWDHLRDGDGRLLKRWRAGSAGIAALLDDHAFLVWGLLELYQADGDPRWLRRALEVNARMLARFHDPDRGGFYLAPDDAGDLIVRAKESYDGALPSGASVAALNLVRLARLTGASELEEHARGTLRAFGDEVRRAPAAHTQMLAALDFLAGPAFELVLSGRADSDDMRAARAALGRVFAPRVALLLRAEGAAAEALAQLAPFTAGQTPLDGRATFYLCRDFACEAPTTDLEGVLATLAAGHGPR
jgi:uncharacterized protein YyaL (SSP411 family)